MAETLTRDAREIVERARALASARGATEAAPTDVLKATLEQTRGLADSELKALGADPQAILARLPANGDGAQPTLHQLLANAGREAGVLGHYQVDSIHLLLAMLYSDSPATASPLRDAGVSLYDLRAHVQTGSKTAVPDYGRPSRRPDRDLRRRPLPSLRGVVSVSPFFLGVIAAAVVSGGLLWTGAAPALTGVLTTLFVVSGWVVALCIHEFGHAFVAYLGGDTSVVGAGYLSLNPLRYQNIVMSLILPIVFLLLGGIALPGGAVYINHSALRTKAWSSAVSLAGPAATLLCGIVIAVVFTIASTQSSFTQSNLNFFAALALLAFFLGFAVVLNLLPVPGLDGFGAIRPWLPFSMQMAAARYGMLGMYAVFLLLWVAAPVRSAFFQLVSQLVALGNIPVELIVLGQLNMRFL